MRNEDFSNLTTKERVLRLLENEKGHYVSGVKIAQETCLTKGAIWKAVSSLREEGYVIEGLTKKGYSLIPNENTMSESNIKKYMHMYANEISIRAFEKTESTNTLAREFAERGHGQFTAIVAEEQTKGRGRLGRSFYSPAGSGIYMSLILRPTLSPAKALYITTAAAAAAAEAIESVCGVKTEIKWVNDVLCNGKKVCGILTEGSFDPNGRLSYAILGIGVNVFPPKEGFPTEISGVASHLIDEPLYELRSRLAAEILERFIFYYSSIESKPFMKSYKKRLCWIGDRVDVISGDTRIPATVTGLSDNLELEVVFDDGKRKLLSSGEVSVRLSDS